MDWVLCGIFFSPVVFESVQMHHYAPLSSTGPEGDFESVTMKVTVTFGQTGVVVPCKDGWTVRDLIQQATLRYRKLLEQVRWEIHTTNPYFILCIHSFVVKEIKIPFIVVAQNFSFYSHSPSTNCYLYIYENHYICEDVVLLFTMCVTIDRQWYWYKPASERHKALCRILLKMVSLPMWTESESFYLQPKVSLSSSAHSPASSRTRTKDETK